MLNLITSTISSTAEIGAVLGAVPAPGNYFSFTKIVLSLVAFGVLARTMTWTDADLGRVHGPRTVWNIIMLLAGLLAVIVLMLVPNFLVALLLFVAITSAGLGSYALWRDSVVAESDRVFTAAHLKKVLLDSGEKAAEKSLHMPELQIVIQQTNGATVVAPDDEVLQTGFQLAHFLLADVLIQRATDVAIIPSGQTTRLLYRIDGVTSERQRLTVQDSSAFGELYQVCRQNGRSGKETSAARPTGYQI